MKSIFSYLIILLLTGISMYFILNKHECEPDTLIFNELNKLTFERDSINNLYDSLTSVYNINEAKYKLQIKYKEENIKSLIEIVQRYDTLINNIAFMPGTAIMDSITRYYSAQDIGK